MYTTRPRPRGVLRGFQGYKALPVTRVALEGPSFTPGETPTLSADDEAYLRAAPVEPLAGSQAPLASAAAGAPPAAVAAPAAAAAASTGNAFGAAAGKVGNFVKENPVGIANAVLGVAGAVMNATTKLPSVPAYQDFTPTLAPAVGMDPGAKQALLNRITRNQLRAGQAITPDAAVTMAGRLQAAGAAGEQQQQVETQDQQILQQNQQQRQQQQVQVEQYNHQNREGRRMAVFEQQSRQAEARRATGTAMVQGAATYFTQADAARRQDAQAEIQQGYQNEASMKRTRYVSLMQAMGSGNLTPAQRQAYQAEIDQLEAESTAAGQGPQRTTQTTTVTRADGGTVPVLIFQRGGKLTTSVELSTGGAGRRAADPLAHMQQEFRRSMDRVTDQATRQFGETLRQALKLRSRPLAGGGVFRRP